MQMTKKQSATLLEQLNRIISEGRNPHTMDIDVLPTIEILEKINQEDAGVADAVRKTIPHIAKAVVVSDQSAVPVTKEDTTRVYADK